jgi:Family of unknown function (DUF6502)
LDLAFDCGLDTIELISLLREVSIQRAVKRQSRPGERISISRISAVTGISRGEISGLINSKSRAKSKTTSHESVLNRILRGWRSDARFLIRRRPKSLALFGRAASFEALAKTYGRGLPIRAILDELICVGAIEVSSSRMVLLKKDFAIHDCTAHKDIQALLAQIIELFIEVSGARYNLEAKIDSDQRRRNFKRVG